MSEKPLVEGARAERITGTEAGPSLWIWIPRGGKAPSMVQAIAELRDALDPGSLRGALTLVLDGARPETMARAAAGAAAVIVLHEGPNEQAARLELDVDDRAARAIARGLGVPLLVKGAFPSLGAPRVDYLDGTEGRAPAIDRSVVARTRRALESLLAALSMIDGRVDRPSLRTVIKARLTVDRGDLGPGGAEVSCKAGDVIRAGSTLAQIGRPGARRATLAAPTSGVVLSIDRATSGPTIVLGRVERALPKMERRARAALRRTVGWCEWVALPELGVPRLKAKIDTGARSCALHVVSYHPTADGALELAIPTDAGTVHTRCRPVGATTVRDSGGHAERRPLIETTLDLGGDLRRVRVTLADRGDMLFPMLIGRTALSGTIVDPSRAFLLGR
jgi:hypothetical protein